LESIILSVDVACATLAILVQLIIYPTLRHVNPEHFHDYHVWYTQRITWVVGPLMVAQVLGHAFLLVETPFLIEAAAALLVILTWVITGVKAVPIHARLSREGQDARMLQSLLHANKMRTLCWVGVVFLWIGM